MNGVRIFTLIGGLLGFLTGAGFATPPQIIAKDERFFGSGGDTYAVLRTVTDNLGSYYRNRVATTLIERSKEGSVVRSEVLLLDREEIVDASYEGPGKAPVKIVIHAKDGEAVLGTLLERWPDQGFRLSPEELARFQIHEGAVRFDERLQLIPAKVLLEAWRGEAPAESGWAVEGGIELGDTICLKLASKEEDGDSATLWVGVSSDQTMQVRAYRKMQPVYLVAGTYGSKDKAVEQAAKWVAALKARKYNGFHPQIWKLDDSLANPEYVVVDANSTHLIEAGKVAELEAALETHLLPMTNARLSEWIPLAGE